jgi:predicted methyltransferase
MMKHAVQLVCTFAMFWLVACAEPESTTSEQMPSAERGEPSDAPPVAPESPSAIQAAIDHPDRPAGDRARDADRRPDQILAFYGVEPGMTVVEYIAGGGYYTELLSRTVGESGHVYSTRVRDERLEGGRLPNVTPIQDSELGVEPGTADLAFTALNYHDLVGREVPREPMLAQIMQQLRPGGIFAVIDHAAEDGSGARDADTLHRIDEQLVKDEVLAAGFELVEESDLLRHPEDDRTQRVFAEGVRGKTDRFVLMFRKPQSEGAMM